MNKLKFGRPSLFLAVFLLFLLAPLTPSIRNGSRDVEARIDELLARMTLEEKLGQLQQLDGEGNGSYRPEHPDLIRKGLLGATLNVRGAKNTNELQHAAMEESRLKIPVLFGFE